MASRRANIKNEKLYEGLKRRGMSKQRVARIANSPGASNAEERSRTPDHPSSRSSRSRQGGTRAHKKSAGRKGGRAAARRS